MKGSRRRVDGLQPVRKVRLQLRYARAHRVGGLQRVRPGRELDANAGGGLAVVLVNRC